MTTGGVAVVLAVHGKRKDTAKLRYQTPELVRLEDETGLTLTELQERMAKSSLSAVVSVLWAGMIHAEPEITKSEVADRLDIARLGSVADAIGRALEKAFPEVDENADENPPTAE